MQQVYFIVAFPVELDCRETGYLRMLHLVGRGVHFGDDDVLVALKLFCQLIVDGGKFLAMSTPVNINKPCSVMYDPRCVTQLSYLN